MTEYKPQFPRTVAGTEWRAPLVHPEIEAIAKRLDHLYRDYSLSETHRAEMLVRYALLADADKAIDTLTASVARFVDSASLPLGDPGIRPKKPRGYGDLGDALKVAVGFALRVGEWVQRLEDLYGITALRHGGVSARSCRATRTAIRSLSPSDDI
jgi:hypothetical protein